MIPSTTSKLLASEDWTKIYQSFKNADFKSYDFETLRRTMIAYIQENYPEDFNDFIESSEYIALIDVIAFLGQNLSFRIDLNARENFLETAQRRDSVLKLAQLIGYNASRNVPAHGFLKVTALNTSDNVYDVNGTNLADTTIIWNDPTNENWYQQFITILNSSMSTNFGKSISKKVIGGIETELYSLNSLNEDVPLYNFVKSINGTNMSFEVVSATFEGKDYVYEAAPAPGNSLSFIYKNDNQGSSSINTGFFFHFRQGTLGFSSFNISNPVPNEIIGLNANNINNTDIWLWQIGLQGNYEKLWTQVPNVVGNNVIYNSVNKNTRTLYAVTSRVDDQIDLNFADGIFGDLPKGDFQVFYRQSNGLSYSIKPEQLSGIIINVPYQNAVGQQHTLQVTLSLQYTVSNSAGSESNSSIQTKAPQTYYTQNRMITGEDYNIAPLNAGSDILKVKSINRVSSGVSKYFDFSDVSGNYGKTNIFANDGILYKEDKDLNFEFEYVNRSQVLGLVKDKVAMMIASPEMESFYNENYSRINLSGLGLTFKEVNAVPGQSRGYFYDSMGSYAVGYDYTESELRYISVDSLVRFNAPIGKYFDENNVLKNIPAIANDVLGFDLINFVEKARGNYSYNTYYIATVRFLPLYTSNSAYTTQTLGTKYGLFRDPDFDGLKFWVDQSLNYNLSIDDIIAREAFFKAALEYDTVRCNTASKSYQSLYQAGFSTRVSYTNEIPSGGTDHIWVAVAKIVGNGADLLDDGTGPLIFAGKVPDGAIPVEIVPKYPSVLGYPIENEIANIATTFKNFGLTINLETRDWEIITNSNLNLLDVFSLNYQGNLEDEALDSSWVISFIWTGKNYKVTARTINYIFESEKETAFFVDKTSINYDYVTNSVVKDKIEILPINLVPNASTFTTETIGFGNNWQINDSVVEADGFSQPTRVKVSLYDYNNSLKITNPDSFIDVVGNTWVFFKYNTAKSTYSITRENVIVVANEQSVTNSQKVNNQLFFFTDVDLQVVKYWSSSLSAFVYTDMYFGRKGRSDIKFHYVHNSGNQRRIDPSKSNLIDIYVLTTSYDTAFRSYLLGNSSSEPSAPTSNDLEQNYSEYLNPIKAISDELVYHPVKYKILFGDKANSSLKAKFKAVRNPNRITNDNELKTKIFTAINDFFAIENWDFGQTFYFSELSTYVMNSLTPDITNFIIVPIGNSDFGSLYEISCLGNELFISAATVDNIEIIDAITASQLKASNIVTSDL